MRSLYLVRRFHGFQFNGLIATTLYRRRREVSFLCLDPPSLSSKMNCGEDDSPPYIASYRNGPYSSSIASSASSSSASVWSDASSQSSDDSSVTGASDDLDAPESCCYTRPPAPVYAPANRTGEQGLTLTTQWPRQKVPAEQRQHPRRTSAPTATRTGCPPALVRQCDRKVNFVDSLVGKPTP